MSYKKESRALKGHVIIAIWETGQEFRIPDFYVNFNNLELWYFKRNSAKGFMYFIYFW